MSALRHGLHVSQASLAWCDETINRLTELERPATMNTLEAHRFAHRKPWAFSALVVVAAGGLDLILKPAAATQTGDTANLADSVTAVLPAVGSSIVLAGYGLLAWPRRWQPAGRDAVARPAEPTAIAQAAADSPAGHHV